MAGPGVGAALSATVHALAFVAVFAASLRLCDRDPADAFMLANIVLIGLVVGLDLLSGVTSNRTAGVGAKVTWVAGQPTWLMWAHHIFGAAFCAANNLAGFAVWRMTRRWLLNIPGNSS